MEGKINKFKDTAVVVIKEYFPNNLQRILHELSSCNLFRFPPKYELYINGKNTNIIVAESCGNLYFESTNELITKNDILKIMCDLDNDLE